MKARFVAACAQLKQLPGPTLAEVAIAGRSNCGKSSLINAVTRHGKLARTSSTPGRTRQLFLFEVDLGQGPFMLVDLPGYGYAKVSKSDQGAWGQLINGYIDTRPTLRGLLLLNDIRRPVAAEEFDLARWAAERELGLSLVLTKADKLAKNKRFQAQAAAARALSTGRRPLAFSVRDEAAAEAVRAELQQLAGVLQPDSP